LEGIQEELLVNKIQLEEVIRNHEVAISCSRNVIKLCHKDVHTLNSQQINSLVNCAISYWTYNPRLGFIKSIISSGKLSHIKNERLLTLLSQFEDHVHYANEGQSWTKELWKGELSQLIKKYIPTTTKQRLKNNQYSST